MMPTSIDVLGLPPLPQKNWGRLETNTNQNNLGQAADYIAHFQKQESPPSSSAFLFDPTLLKKMLLSLLILFQ